jgi:hypothetical protein
MADTFINLGEDGGGYPPRHPPRTLWDATIIDPPKYHLQDP